MVLCGNIKPRMCWLAVLVESDMIKGQFGVVSTTIMIGAMVLSMGELVGEVVVVVVVAGVGLQIGGMRFDLIANETSPLVKI